MQECVSILNVTETGNKLSLTVSFPICHMLLKICVHSNGDSFVNKFSRDCTSIADSVIPIPFIFIPMCAFASFAAADYFLKRPVTLPSSWEPN